MADFSTFNDTDSPENTNLSDGTNPTIKAVVEPTSTALIAATNAVVTKGLMFGKDSLDNYYPFTVDASGRAIISSIISAVAVTQSTSPWVVSGTVTAAEDKNYGVVGANTARSAAQIGNATGAADFNFGAAGAQTLRTAALIGNATGLANFNYGAAGAQTLRVASQIGNATGAANFNYGAVGAQTLRVASQIGNATGAALFGAGTTTAQVLRVVLPTDQTAIPATQSGTWTVTASEDKNYGTVGATTLRVASQIGNATGAAAFGAGVTNAQTLRVVLPTDQTAIPASQSGSWTVAATQSGTWNIGTLTSITNPVAVTGTFWQAVQPVSGTVAVTQSTSPWIVSGTVTSAEDKNYGTVGANTLRTAAQIGNATGAADFNTGATGAQTLRTVANQGAPNTAANGWFQRLTDGTDNVAVTANNDLSVSDGLSNGGVNGALTLTTANTAYQAKVGASALVNLKNLTITALDDMYWGYNNTVTTATGSPLYKNQVITFDVDPDSTFQVWLVASANGKTARIAEST